MALRQMTDKERHTLEKHIKDSKVFSITLAVLASPFLIGALIKALGRDILSTAILGGLGLIFLAIALGPLMGKAKVRKDLVEGMVDVNEFTVTGKRFYVRRGMTSYIVEAGKGELYLDKETWERTVPGDTLMICHGRHSGDILSLWDSSGNEITRG